MADLYLPIWLAARIFPICGTLYGVALVLIGLRLFSGAGLASRARAASGQVGRRWWLERRAGEDRLARLAEGA